MKTMWDHLFSPEERADLAAAKAAEETPTEQKPAEREGMEEIPPELAELIPEEEEVKPTTKKRAARPRKKFQAKANESLLASAERLVPLLSREALKVLTIDPTSIEADIEWFERLRDSKGTVEEYTYTSCRGNLIQCLRRLSLDHSLSVGYGGAIPYKILLYIGLSTLCGDWAFRRTSRGNEVMREIDDFVASLGSG